MSFPQLIAFITTYYNFNNIVNVKFAPLSIVANYATNQFIMSKDIKINKDWFMSAFKERGTSLRKAAKHLDIDPSAMSRVFSGQRKMQMTEAQDLARFLNLPIADVLANAGMDIHQLPENSTIQLLKQIDETGQIIDHSQAGPLPYHITSKARTNLAADKAVIAAEVSASDGPLEFWDGATFLFREVAEVEGQLSNCLCAVTMSDERSSIAHIVNMRPSGEANLILPNGKKTKDILKTATAVLCIIP